MEGEKGALLPVSCLTVLANLDDIDAVCTVTNRQKRKTRASKSLAPVIGFHSIGFRPGSNTEPSAPDHARYPFTRRRAQSFNAWVSPSTEKGGGKRKERGSRSFPIKPGATTLDEALSFFFFSISRLHRIHGYIHAHKFHDSCRYDSRQPSWRLRDNVKHARTDWVGSIHRSRRQEKKKKKAAKRRLEKSLVTHVTDLN